MAPPINNILDKALSLTGRAAGEYFKWNFSDNIGGLGAFNAASKSGLRPTSAFAASLLTSNLLRRGSNAVDIGRDYSQSRLKIGDEGSWLNKGLDAVVDNVLPTSGKMPRTYDEMRENVLKNGGKESQMISREAYNNWKDREYNGGWWLRYNKAGEGSGVKDRDYLTVFGKPVINPLYAFDESLGKETVNNLSKVGAAASLATSAVALKPFFDISGGKPVSGYTPAMTARILGGSIAKGLGVAAVGFGAVQEYNDSINIQKDSQTRALTNTAASTGLGWLGATKGAAITAPFGAPLGPLGVAAAGLVGGVVGGVVSSSLGGWMSDRVLDLFGEKNTQGNADKVYAAAEQRYQNALNAKYGSPINAQTNSELSQRTPATETRNMANPNPNRNGNPAYSQNTGTTTINSQKDTGYNRKYDPKNLSEGFVENERKLQFGERKDFRGQDLKSLADLQNFAMQSRDRRYGTDATERTTDNKTRIDASVNRERNRFDFTSNIDKNQRQERVGLDGNRVTREVGFNKASQELVGSKYKTDAEKFTNLDKNAKVLEFGKYDSDNKYIKSRSILDVTEIAKAEIKEGVYGATPASRKKFANDNQNFLNWKRQNDANFDYADRQNAAIKMGRDIGNAERAYSDSRVDLQNDRSNAMHRFQVEQNNKNADRSARFEEQKQSREDRKADFGLRSSQINAEIARSAQDSTFRNRKLEADTAEVFSNTRLKNLQFDATRSDIGYNRGNQFGRSLAF